MQLKLGSATVLSDGSNYNTSAQAAMAVWNGNLGTVQFSSTVADVGLAVDDNQINEMSFGSQVYPGEDFDANVLAVTVSYLSTTPRANGTYRRTQSDIILNSKYTWDSYRGGLRTPEDIRRVAMHELGHVLGLGHPDLATPPQSVAALMNSMESNIDTVTADDIAGAQALYGNQPVQPSIRYNIYGVTAYTGETVSFSITAFGTPPLTYQWQKDGVPLAGATDSTLTIVGVKLSDAGNYKVVISNAAGSVVSSEARLTVNTSVAPVIYVGNTDYSLAYGSTLLLSLNVQGVPYPTFVWKKDGVEIPASNTNILFRGSVTKADSGRYTLTATNIAGSVTSPALTVTVTDPVPPSFTAQPQSVTVAAGKQVTLTVAVTGSGAINLQWYRDGVPMPGIINSTYSIMSATPDVMGTYTVKASSEYGTAESNPATLTVLPAPLPSFSGTMGGRVIINQSYGLNLGASPDPWGGQPTSYQWLKDGMAIPGATNSSYVRNPATASDAGVYSVLMTGAGGVVASPDFYVVWDDASGSKTWLDAYRLGNVIYFLAAVPGRIMRYDLSTESWLPTVYLSATQAPTAFLPTNEGVFVAYGTSVVRRSLDLQSETVVASSPTKIKCLFSFGNLVYFYNGTSVVSYDRSTLAQGPTSAPPLPWAGYGFFNRTDRPVFSSALKRAYSTRPDVSPDDIIQVTVGSDGTFSAAVDSPYHGDFRIGSRQYLSPDEQLLFDNGGAIFKTSDLTYVAAV
ncbi:MAG: immunoglobulin domain-containing protein, partial [Verrucomicrobia bacterium]|nr:immunoglobulin domain-containing protein [Verrucomicrobiota bacterium]